MNSEVKIKKFPIMNAAGEPLADIALVHLWADVFALKVKVLKIEAVSGLEKAIRHALEVAASLNARVVMFRLIKGETASEEISDLLQKLSFKKKSERIEFKKSVDELPSDDDLEIKWKNAEELGWSQQEIANTLKQVAEGDPDTDPNEDPLLFIQDFLADPVLTSGLRCIHIGFFDDEIAALTVVQINPKTGWSRISYMGVVPKFRKKNIGAKVHRYSFRVMKSEGGKLYHGGTTSTNYGMIRLFENSGCNKFCEMEEWNFSLKDGSVC